MALAISKENFQESLAQDKPVVIDFWAEWCGPCRMVQHTHHPLHPQRRGGRQAGRRRIEERPGGEDRSAVVR